MKGSCRWLSRYMGGANSTRGKGWMASCLAHIVGVGEDDARQEKLFILLFGSFAEGE